MGKASGFDTVGVTKVGALRDGRISLQFTGTDGDVRNVFIPAASVSNMVTTLLALCAKIELPKNVGDKMEGQHNISIRQIGIGAAEDGSEFSIVVRTIDNLELRFQLTPESIESFAGGLIATLSAHGRSPTQTRPEVTRH